jgi:hypothetical protein
MVVYLSDYATEMSISMAHRHARCARCACTGRRDFRDPNANNTGDVAADGPLPLQGPQDILYR